MLYLEYDTMYFVHLTTLSVLGTRLRNAINVIAVRNYGI